MTDTYGLDAARLAECQTIGKELGKEIGRWALMELPKDISVRTDGLVAVYKRQLLAAGETEEVADAAAYTMGIAIVDEVAAVIALSDFPAGHA